MKKVSKISDVFKKVKQEWFKDLAVIDLEGMAMDEKKKAILQGIKECLEKNSLVIMEGTDGADGVFADFDSGNGKITVMILYGESNDFLEIYAVLGEILPIRGNRKALYEMLCLLNSRLSAWHFVVKPHTRIFAAKAGIFLTNHFNLQELFLLLRHVLANMVLSLDVIDEFLASDKTPEAILAEQDERFRMEAEQNPDLCLNEGKEERVNGYRIGQKNAGACVFRRKG